MPRIHPAPRPPTLQELQRHIAHPELKLAPAGHEHALRPADAKVLDAHAANPAVRATAEDYLTGRRLFVRDEFANVDLGAKKGQAKLALELALNERIDTLSATAELTPDQRMELTQDELQKQLLKAEQLTDFMRQFDRMVVIRG